MQIRKEKNGLFIILLTRGESVRQAIEQLCQEQGIGGAMISAIGAVENPELGYYDLPSKTYQHRSFPGIWELDSFNGNIAMKDGKAFLHAHVSLSGPDFMVFGGHFFDAKVGVVVEMFITPTDPINRKPDESVGLPCWNL